MKKHICFILSVTCVVPLLAAHESIVEMISPKLKQFLITHDLASENIKKTFSDAFNKRSVQIYYFYTQSDRVPRAGHYYPAADTVVMAVRENQSPLDEYICLIFEAINSEAEPTFAKLCRDASEQSISKIDFARQMLQTEFITLLKVQEMIGRMKFDTNEIAASIEFKSLMATPTNFDSYLAYAQRDTNRNMFNEYENKYEMLAQRGTNSPHLK